ncbi:MAG: glycosyltransferase family 39 protein [Chloroflexi bacterium]|nr:glycosyltransferase family 39 protein [Chloroflexota bacterium]
MDRTTRFTATILLVFGSLILLDGFRILYVQAYLNVTAPILLILAGALIFVLGVLFGAEKMPARILSVIERAAVFMRVRRDQLAMLLVSVILPVMAQQAAGYEPKMTNPFIAVFAWSAALVMVAAGGWKTNEAGKYPNDASLLTRLETPLTLAGIFVFAFFLRIIFPESIPIWLSGDEGSSGIAAALFAWGESNNLFRAEWYDFPALYFAIPGLLIRMLGQTVIALRLSSAIPGALTVVAAFWFTRAALGKRAAWFAAIFLATLHFHVHFSRIALNNIWDGLWITVALGSLWYAWQNERRNAYILAGLSMGLAQYFYTSSRTLPVIILLWLVFVGSLDRSRLKRALPDLGLMFLVSIVTAMPLILFFVKFPLELFAPMQRVSILGGNWLNITAQSRGLPQWRILLEQIWLGIGAYAYAPLKHWYLPGIPILRPSAAVFFISGLTFSLVRNDRKVGLLLLLWLLAFALLGALSESTPAAQRYPGSAPAVAILVAVGVSEFGRLFARLWPSLRKSLDLAAVIILLLLAAREVHFYFFEYTPGTYERMVQDNGMVGYRLGLYLRPRPAGAQIVFLGKDRMGFYSIPSTQYLAPQFQGIDINFPWGAPENPLPEKDHLLFIVLPEAEAEIPLVQNDYPGGTLSKEYADDGTVLFYVYDYNPMNLP